MAIKVTSPTTNGIVISTPVTCKDCGSTAIVKFGTYKGVQRYWCKTCERKFKDDNTLFHMKVSPENISSALSMYYTGMSINDVCNHLNQEHDYHPSKSVVYNWITKYTDQAIKQFRDYHPQVGDTWIADETVLSIDGQNVWMYDIIDYDTRYLLATRITQRRTTKDAELLMKEASKKAGKHPKKVITDSNYSYLDGIELAFGSDTEHIQSYPMAKENDTQRIERWHETLKDRTKVMKGLKDIESAIQFTDGFLVYYNYFRPHESLNGKTPAEVAKVKYDIHNWKTLCALPVSKESEILLHQTPKIRIPKQRIRLPRVNVGRPRKNIRNHPQGVYTNKKGSVLSRNHFRGSKRIG